jgi:hypothetical protein
MSNVKALNTRKKNINEVSAECSSLFIQELEWIDYNYNTQTGKI